MLITPIMLMLQVLKSNFIITVFSLSVQKHSGRRAPEPNFGDSHTITSDGLANALKFHSQVWISEFIRKPVT